MYTHVKCKGIHIYIYTHIMYMYIHIGLAPSRSTVIESIRFDGVDGGMQPETLKARVLAESLPRGLMGTERTEFHQQF